MRLFGASLVLAVLLLSGCGDTPPVEKTQIVLRIAGDTLVLDTATVAEASIVKETCPLPPGRVCLSVTFTENGRAWFTRITTDNVGKPVEVVVNGEVVTRPVIREPITGGTALLTGVPKEIARRFIESLP